MYYGISQIPDEEVYVDMTFYSYGSSMSNVDATLSFYIKVEEMLDNVSVIEQTSTSYVATGTLGQIFPFYYRYTPFKRTDYNVNRFFNIRGMVTNNSGSTLDMGTSSLNHPLRIEFIKT